MKILNKKSEQEFRKVIGRSRMDEHWKMTWHEDHDVSPGVPDLHYVMIEGKFNVGWLELKSTDLPISATNRIEIQPSQHQYIRRWCEYMPIHFLVRVRKTIYLVRGELHGELADVIREDGLAALAVTSFQQEDMHIFLPRYLKEATKV